MSDIVITAAKRTPVGSFLGSFASTPAHELGRIAILAALEQAGVAPDEVDEVIFGQVLTAAQGQNPVRQAAVNAGIPVDRHWQTMLEVARDIESLGFESLWVYDHFHTVPEATQEVTYEAWTLMAALAATTDNVRLGQMCTCNTYRPPSYLAKVAASIDVISGAAVPSSFMRPRRRQAFNPSAISVCMSASFFWIS